MVKSYKGIDNQVYSQKIQNLMNPNLIRNHLQKYQVMTLFKDIMNQNCYLMTSKLIRVMIYKILFKDIINQNYLLITSRVVKIVNLQILLKDMSRVELYFLNFLQIQIHRLKIKINITLIVFNNKRNKNNLKHWLIQIYHHLH